MWISLASQTYDIMPADGYKPRVTSPIAGDGFPASVGGTPFYIVAGGIVESLIADGAITGAKLVNGSAAPGNNKVYGTNASGVLGFKDDPAGGGGGSSETIVLLEADEFKLHIAYTGEDPPTLVESPVATFTITCPAGTIPKSAIIIGTKAASLGGGTTLTLKVVSADGRTTRITMDLTDADTMDTVPMGAYGIIVNQNTTAVAGTLTATIPGVNYNNFIFNVVFFSTYV